VNTSNHILKRLELLHPKKIDLSLFRLKKLLKKLGNPHLNLAPVIHIAGTNGKGSVTSYLRAIYEAANLKVHTYTSPHLIKFNERIRINSRLIDNKYLSSLLEECEKKNNSDPITFFEITTAAAFLAFSRNKTDIILLETGLGGRFDATNVIKNPLCNVITPISMDHMNFLGNSIDKIAFEKVGIIKNKSLVVMSKQKKIVREIVKKEIKKKRSTLFEESSDWKILKIKKNTFILKYNDFENEFPIPKLAGKHQIENAATAISVVKSIKQIVVEDKLIKKGIEEVVWPARMQKINNGKLKKKCSGNFDIWLDGGHNDHAASIILNFVKNWSELNKVLILGMTAGKNPTSFLRKIIDQFNFLILLPIDNHQYVQPYEIKENVKKKLKKNINIECCLNINDALSLISENYSSGKILICGSLYLAGQILKADGFKIK
tara:strand:+ start:37 stop:1338 length:1302 start_codon:yes stop_codon:yes gene_type:complete